MSAMGRFALLVAVVSTPTAHAATPIGKVLQLISDLQAKVVSEGEEAQKVYAEYAEYCDDRSKQLQFEMDTGKSEIAALEATIAQESASISSLGEKVEALAGSLATDDAELNVATGIRAKEQEDFSAEERELMETIDTLDRAIGMLERVMQKGGASMVQLKNAGNLVQALSAMVEASVFSSADAAKLTALVQGGDSDAGMSLGAPEAAVYENQSGDIVATLEGLLDTAREQLAAARKKETAALHSFSMLKQSLEDQIKFSNENMAESKASQSAAATTKATAEGDLSVTSKELAADTDALSELHHNCQTRAEDFEASMKSRGEELKALADAKKVLEEATGAAGTLTYSFKQASFLQVSQRISASPASHEVLRLVRQLARKHHSPALTQLASRMDSALQAGVGAADPFAKVKGLISDMIVRLEDEANADSSHKAYCDKELAKSTEKKVSKSAEIEKLSSKIDQMSARSAELKAEVAALQKGLADLAATQATMTKLRGQEHDLFVKSKKEMEEGIQGVKTGLTILREYYSADGKAHEAAMGSGTSIIGLLEVVESDFLKGLAEATATEGTAAATYESETKQNDIEKVSKEQDVKYKTKEYTDLDKAVAESTSDRSGVQDELDAVLEYLEKLDAQCVEHPETYAERKDRREAELAGLKEALEILEGTSLLQRGPGRRGLRA